MSSRLDALSDAGVSIWLDDLSRARLVSGELARMPSEYAVSGVTTNPTIFAAALAEGGGYAAQLAEQGSMSADEAIMACTATDVRNACDLFAAIYDTTDGYDGRVSIEVAPTLAHDTDGTIAQAIQLRDLVGRENVLIKIPATKAGLPAITAVVAQGISVNVTLIFSEDRYREVMDAYLAGLERAAAGGRDIAAIHSVASFFISRVDAEIDARLAALGRPDLNGRAAIANARVALGAFEEVFGSARFARLAAMGGNKQRPLWASTGVKDAAYPDTLYVSELVADGVVNTMPVKTLLAFADHGELGAPLTGGGEAGRAVLAEIEAAGVDLVTVFQKLEDEGVDKFIGSWHELRRTVRSAQALAHPRLSRAGV